MIPQDPVRLDLARAVARCIAAEPGLTAAAIARRVNLDRAAAGGLFAAPKLDGRLVRRLIQTARFALGVPIIARPGTDDGGYRLPASMAEAEAYAQRCLGMLRHYAGLVAVVRHRADLVTGSQAALPLDLIAGLGMDELAWRAGQDRVAREIGDHAA